MKKRSRLVSNSSSSSFIVIDEEPIDFNFVELKGQTRENILARAKIKCNKSAKVYLTQFISDGIDYDFFHSGDYQWGDQNGPYDEDDYVKVLEGWHDYDSVWIRKEDYIED
jgi:hypothetical protein